MPAEVARLTGLERDDLDPQLPPQIVSTGTAFAIVALRSAIALARLKVKQEEATAWLRERGARWFYVLGPHRSKRKQVHRRVSRAHAVQWRRGSGYRFGGGLRDQLSGGARRRRFGPADHLRQGVEIAAPAIVSLSAKQDSARVTDVRVAGSTVLVAKGRLFLP